MYSLGVVCTNGGVSRIWWLSWIDMIILCVMSSYDKNALMLVLSISGNVCLVLRWALCCWIFWDQPLVFVVGCDVLIVF